MVENLPEQVKLRCVFCQSTDFKVPYQDYIPMDGDVVKCANCGRLKDVTSLQKVAIDNVEKEVVDYMQQYIKKLFKK